MCGPALALIAVTLLAGCQRGVVYQASSLPTQLMAPRVGTLQNVDLSRLARTVGNSQVLYPGDLVQLTIATGLETESPPVWKGRVADDGSINVPLVGNVQVAGLELTQAELVVRGESIRRGTYIDPNVSLALEQRRTNRVTVVGAVTKPGTYELPAAGSDLLTALVAADGLNKEADTVIEMRHPPGMMPAPIAGNGPGGSAGLVSHQGPRPMIPTPPRTVRVDLEQASRTDSGNYYLEDGATVMVMRKPKRFIHVIGLVNKADQFEIPDDQEPRLLDALAMAGGRKLEIADKVHVIRQLPNQSEPVVIEASVRAAKRDATSNIRLTANDVVSVEETMTTMVVGTIREFVRFGFASSIPGF